MAGGLNPDGAGLKCISTVPASGNVTSQPVRTISLQQTKTDYPRIAHLTDRAMLELGSMPHSTSGFVFVNRRTNLPFVDIRKKWWRACRAARMTGTWFHDNRRSFVTNARRRGVPESEIMHLTGHRTRAIFDRYNVVSHTDARDAVARIEAGRKRELQLYCNDNDEAA